MSLNCLDSKLPLPTSGTRLNCNSTSMSLNCKPPISYPSIGISLTYRHPSSYPSSSCMTLNCPLSDMTLNCAHHMACDLTCDGSPGEPRDEPLAPNDISIRHTLDPLQTLIDRLHKSSQLDPDNTLTRSLWHQQKSTFLIPSYFILLHLIPLILGVRRE